MALQFTKATKEQAKLRLALFGPSGSGKTFTALRMATGLTGKIALIDTERGSASKYADRFTFDVLDLDAEHRDIDTYCAAISAAQRAGYDILIIDSLTHAWHELLSEIDKLARAKYKGNTWSAWSEGTPKQRALVDAILNFDGHVLATMRTKTEWTTEQDSRTGKSRPVRVGLAPEQGKGIEYEFDLLMELSVDHVASVLKDRTGKYQDKIIEKPGEDLGAELAAWLSEGEAPTRKPDRGDEMLHDLDDEPVPGVIDFDFVPDMSTWENGKHWTELRGLAVERLGYSHDKHVRNTLAQVFSGENKDALTYAAAWAALVDHQRSKYEPDTVAA